jgi:amidophosphoribosyltransferase
MGKKLAQRWRTLYPDRMPDVIVPAPFTSNTAASAFANELGVRYAEGLYKNAFIGRTFIMANHAARSKHVRYKLTPQKVEVDQQKVLILDDSIVRGTTSREIVKMVREFGAKEIYFVSACPPIRHPCFYGIDIPSRKELLAVNLTEEEIREFLGVDILLYQKIEDLVDAVLGENNKEITRPCLACMDGHYVCGKINEDKMSTIEQFRQRERDSM